MSICKECIGTGKINHPTVLDSDSNFAKCTACNGQGHVEEKQVLSMVEHIENKNAEKPENKHVPTKYDFARKPRGTRSPWAGRRICQR